MGVLEDYAAAVADFNLRDADLTRLVNAISAIAEQLRTNRAHFCFSNAEGGFTMEVVGMPQSQTFDGNQWKSASQINQALVEWHKARDRVKTIWNGLTPSERAVLQPPPEAAIGRQR